MLLNMMRAACFAALLLFASAHAATIGVEVTADELTRARIAVGAKMGLLDNQRNVRPATNAELREFVFGPLKKLVLDYEREVAAQKLQLTPFEPQ